MMPEQEDPLDQLLWNNSPIIKKYPEIQSILDDDNLFDISKGQLLDTEKLQYRLDFFWYHPWLEYHFLNEFLDFCRSSTNCDKRIAIDPRKILPVGEYPIRIQEDYWYGPKFNLSNVDELIYSKVITTHIRLPGSYRNMFGELLRTEFMWSMRNNLKTLQIEEIIPIDTNNPPKRITVKYIHTIRDVTKQAFIHLDGAIRWYEPDKYVSRIDSKLSDHPSTDGYFKLFRVDGEIPNQDWINLIAKFFTGNELIHEYFEQPIEK